MCLVKLLYLFLINPHVAAQIRTPTACISVFGAFFKCALDLYDGKDVSNRLFAATVRDILVHADRDHVVCPEAVCLAHALTAELRYALASPFLKHLPVEQSIEYFQDLDTAVRDGPLSRAASLCNEAAQHEAEEARSGQIICEYGLCTDSESELRYVRSVFRKGMTRAMLMGEVGEAEHMGTYSSLASLFPHQKQTEQHFAASVQDHGWNEVVTPACPKSLDFWFGAAPSAVEPGFDSLLEGPSSKWLPLQETALETAFFLVLGILKSAKDSNVIKNYWPTKSTLLALLRYGRLFGRLTTSGGERAYDCVGDDLDLAIAVHGKEAWAEFIHWAVSLPGQFREAGFVCLLVENAEVLQRSGSYGQLHCVSYLDGWMTSVSLHYHDVTSDDDVEMSRCLAYDVPIDCPRRSVLTLARQPGCLALPNLSLASLTVGNTCIEWMSGGLSMENMIELSTTWEWLRNTGFLSMLDVWEASHDCKQVDLTGPHVAVGVLGLQSVSVRKRIPAGPYCRTVVPSSSMIGASQSAD
eukprot:TRINITY_DN1134_c1_g3_i1.p1 TRINITY_DN1134_c1_g3~~TRINITY_DN1134_c1_g3_i1.p1  ORF type:complete len:526 (-),score=43.85 TRINITY_DN1134_c1_g3_i1:446-2023(-)